MRVRRLALITVLGMVAQPLSAQAASPRPLGPLGSPEAWHCSPGSELAPQAIANAVTMTFTLLEPSSPHPTDSAKRVPLRVITVQFASDGELLLLQEVGFDSTASPRVQMPGIQRAARGVYAGDRVGGARLTEAEVAAAVEVGKELWRRRCAGPRV